MKKYFVYGLAVLVSVLFCGYLYIHFEERIHRVVTKIKEDRRNASEYRKMHAEKVSLAGMKPLVDEDGAWYTAYHIIAHAGGGINGVYYTNSREAWDYTYSRGNRVIDADLTFTTDSILVLRHSWGDNLEDSELPMMGSVPYLDRNGHMQYHIAPHPMSYSVFRNTKIYRQYTPMSCEDMILFMKEHPDLYVAADMKGDVVLKSYSWLVSKAEEMQATDVLDRIIVNVHDYELLDEIRRIYPFKHVTARQHYVHPNNYYELVQFCLNNNIHVVNTSACYANDEGIKLLHQYNIHTIVAIADYVSDMQQYRALGFEGCVSNLLTEDIYHLSE